MVESSSLPALRLDPLVGENAAAMLEALLGDGADLDSLKRLVTDRTGGNSFFIKEMVQSLFERRILARSGTVKVVRPLLQAHLLVTVEGVLAARIDRLQASDGNLLHTVAVLGREFQLRLVQRVAPAPADELERGLSCLQAGDFRTTAQVDPIIATAVGRSQVQKSCPGEIRQCLKPPGEHNRRSAASPAGALCEF
jgi:predicted ATPase